MNITIGTRGSMLARAQTEWIAAQLRPLGHTVAIEVISTLGDRSQASNTPLATFSEKGIFAKELEAALLTGSIDVAVHSMKDLAAVLPAGLHIAAVPLREDVRDVLIGSTLAQLSQGATIGTGSVRRVAVLSSVRPDLRTADIRGNVDTRIRKLRDGEYAAIILAAAGINRLGRQDEIAEHLDPEVFIPDPGQGALAIQCRVDDAPTSDALAHLNHHDTAASTRAERAYLAALGGGCQTPVGAWATLGGGILTLRVFASINGAITKLELSGPEAAPEALGQAAAARIGNAT